MMLPYNISYYGNPHSRTHAYGWEAEEAVEEARKVLFPVVLCEIFIWGNPMVYQQNLIKLRVFQQRCEFTCS